MGRHDDLWSLFYMLIEFFIGQLPWRRLKDKEQVGSMKEKYDHSIFIKNLPDQFKLFLEHIQDLNYSDVPKYECLRELLLECMRAHDIRESDLFDWELKPEVETSSSRMSVAKGSVDSAGLVKTKFPDSVSQNLSQD